MIICFSGTCNSLHVARRLVGLLGNDRLISVDAATRSADIVLSRGERLVWVMPVYCWGVPPVMLEVIRGLRLTATDDSRHYLVATCGDDCGLTASQWRRAIEARGWRAAGAWTVQMPNNYVSMKGFDVDPEAVAAAKLRRSSKRVSRIAQAILAGSDEVDVVRGRWPWLKSRVIRPWFNRFMMSPRKFRYTDACTNCGRCVRACPMQNIRLDAAGPHWGNRCAMCLGCYHVCPVHAVAWGRATDGKGQYTYSALRRTMDQSSNQCHNENTPSPRRTPSSGGPSRRGRRR